MRAFDVRLSYYVLCAALLPHACVQIATEIPAGSYKINEKTCGITGIARRIINGVPSEEHQFPWAVLLLIELDSGDFSTACTGSLITWRHIITAGHCVRMEGKLPSKITAYFGHSKHQKANSLDVQRYYLHDGFDLPTFSNDIAVVLLPKSIKGKQNVNTLCLPIPFFPVVDEKGKVYGWGATTAIKEEQSLSDQMMFITMTVKSDCTCLLHARLKQYFRPGEQLCVLGSNNDACQGDSGGPFIVQRRGHAVVVGLVSNGIGCNEPDLPSFFTNVSRYTDWILNVVAEPESSYTRIS